MSAEPIQIATVDWRDIRCSKCNRLLFRVRGLAEIETVCPRCSTKLMWPDLTKLVIVVTSDKISTLPKSVENPAS